MLRTRTNGMGMEIGLLVGLLFVNILFQFIPGTELGRLSTRTMDDVMEAVDAYLPYDSSVEDKQDEVIEENIAIEEQLQEVIEQVTPDVTISLSTDTIGLNTVETIENFSGLDNAALAAAINTRWTSARNNGLAVGVWTTLTYNFSLSD